MNLSSNKVRLKRSRIRIVLATWCVMAFLGSVPSPVSASSVPPGTSDVDAAGTVSTQSHPVQEITLAQYEVAAGTDRVAVTSGSQATSARCFSYWFSETGYNAVGTEIWQFSIEPYWCSNDVVISQAFTDTSGVAYKGWTYKGLMEEGDEYGVGWNEYYTYAQGLFCNSNCSQIGEPFLEAWVYANGSAQGA